MSKSHYIVDGFGFDDHGQRVPVVWPQFPEGTDPEERGAALAALDMVRRCLCLVVENGHRDGARG